MGSLSDLKSGRLAGANQVKMAAGLAEFPPELFDLADTLVSLDLSGNRLRALPAEFSRFKKLKILFLSNNDFECFPEVLAECPGLSMVGFKANRIERLPEQALPAEIRWLILTDNRIEKLPRSIGRNTRLQKLMLAGNRLRALPDEMANCTGLELLRISANRIEALPSWLLKLPRLSWLAFAGNPCSRVGEVEHALSDIHWDELQMGCRLGEGASGVISQARWNDAVEVALKEFKGSVTSDGLPADEIAAAIAAGQHANLVKLFGRLVGHPEQKSGLLLALIDRGFENLAGPPSLESCTRDVYAKDRSFSLDELLKLAAAIASVARHLHERGILHGDLYAHNILVNQAADCLLGDFGAATRYDAGHPDPARALERIEVRAFGCLLEELLARLDPQHLASRPDVIARLGALQQRCMERLVASRPSFAEIGGILDEIGAH